MGENVREELGAPCWGTWEGGKGTMGEGATLVQACMFAMAKSALGLAFLPDCSPPM
jgi:hypothetical protein